MAGKLAKYMRIALLALLFSAGSYAVLAAPLEVPRLTVADMQQTHSLSGRWQFIVGDDLSWATPGYDDSAWAARSLPEHWPIGGYPESGNFAWYRLTLKFDLDSPEKRDYLSHLALRMGKVLSAYELYAGGKLVGSIGKLPPLSEINHDRTRVFALPASAIAQDGTLVLALRVWGGSELAVDTWGGGPYEGDFRIGEYSTLLQTSFLSQTYGFMASVLCMGFGIYHLYLYRRNRQLDTYLWFGLMALDIGIYGLMVNQWRYRLDWSFIAFEKLEFGVIYLFPALVIQMVWSLLSMPVGRILRLYQFSFLALSIVVVGVPGFDIHYLTLRSWQLWSLPLLVALPWILIRETRNGNPEARTALIGVLIFAAACVNDLMIDLAGWNGSRIVPVGFMAILVSMAISLANRFTTVLNNLEEEVAQRTVDLSSANQMLAEVARRDPLTGLLNRRGFIEQTKEEIQRYSRTGREFSIVLTDLDKFKDFNDEHGHACGDHVLREAARLLGEGIRDIDDVARWGGEEFMIVLPETDTQGAMLLAEKLRASIEAQQFTYAGKSLSVTMTFGIATFHKGESLDHCIARADAALYEGKEQGRNRIMVGNYENISLVR